MILFRRFVVVLFAAALLSGCASNTPANNPNEVGFVAADGSAVLRDESERTAAPELVFDGISPAATWSVESARGSVVLLNVWGPWCAPCRKEFPDLQKLSETLGPDGLEIVGVATRTTATSVTAFTSAQKISFRQVADFDSLIVSSISGVPSSTVPSSILIDRKGRVAGWVLGAADPVLLKSMLKSLLEESA